MTVSYTHLDVYKRQGHTYNFKAEEYDLAVTFNKELEVGTQMDENSIIQIELMSRDEATSGYYFAKKTVRENVDSTVILDQKTEEGLKMCIRDRLQSIR